jgi:hypothetical protein
LSVAIARSDTIAVADMFADGWNRGDSGRYVRGGRSVAGMDDADIDELPDAELQRGVRHGRHTADGWSVRRSQLGVVRRSCGDRTGNAGTDV